MKLESSDVMLSSDPERLIVLLGQDVSEQYQLLLTNDSPMLRRSFVRSFFAYVEGVTHLLKNSAMSKVRLERGVYNAGEVSLLAEENYAINNKGELTKQRKFLPTAENFLFALKMFFKAIPEVQIDIQVGSEQWQQFLTALQIRHRIVHPKHEVDLLISDREKELLMGVCTWFNYVVISKLVESVKAFEKVFQQQTYTTG